MPPWIRQRLGAGGDYAATKSTLATHGVETICTEAKCPNRGNCWERKTATVLILGSICTRNCGFCSVAHGRPEPPDPQEPLRVSRMVGDLGIKYLVITSVDRDDLADGGASQFTDVVLQCRGDYPETSFELLVPDFKDVQQQALEVLSRALPFVFGHNVETVPELYGIARRGGDYSRSLELLRLAKEHLGTETKTSIMLGLGETDSQIRSVLEDLRSVGVDRLCMGQYLQPTRGALEVEEYVHPDKFAWWRQQALDLGFTWVISEPFARSSYHADEIQA